MNAASFGLGLDLRSGVGGEEDQACGGAVEADVADDLESFGRAIAAEGEIDDDGVVVAAGGERLRFFELARALHSIAVALKVFFKGEEDGLFVVDDEQPF